MDPRHPVVAPRVDRHALLGALVHLVSLRERSLDLTVVLREALARLCGLVGAPAACVLLSDGRCEGLDAAGAVLPAEVCAQVVGSFRSAVDEAVATGLPVPVRVPRDERVTWVVPLGWQGSSLGALVALGAGGSSSVDPAEGEPISSFASPLAALIAGIRREADDTRRAEERSRIEQERLVAQLREANTAKEQLLAVLSHELRNPMSAVLAGIQVLQGLIPAEERARRALEILERNARLQARLVNDLLDFSRIAHGRMPTYRAPLMLDAVARSTVEALQKDAGQAGLGFSMEAEPEVWVEGDFERLQQAVMNLAANAIKFTPAGGEVRIKVQGSRFGVREGGATGPASGLRDPSEPGWVRGTPVSSPEPRTLNPEPFRARIIVEDTGIGISPELLPHLFEMFRQGEVAGRRAMGLGIGLALVKSICEMHGGRAWAESAGLGQGSRFVIDLPRVARPDAAALGEGSEPDAPVDVLLVVDNGDTRILLAQSLETFGYRVHPYPSGEDALAHATRLRPRLIVSDIRLAGMDGCEFLRRARRLPGWESVPAIAISASDLERDVRAALEAGYAEHITKPVDPAVLDRSIRRWLHLRAPGSSS